MSWQVLLRYILCHQINIQSKNNLLLSNFTSRIEDIKSLRLGAVVTFGAWLPMSNKFHKDKLTPTSKDIKTGPLQTLQVL